MTIGLLAKPAIYCFLATMQDFVFGATGVYYINKMF